MELIQINSARFGVLSSVVGSVTVRWRMGVQSGNFQVSSSVVINSGAAVFDQLNYGKFTEFGFVAANSQTPTYLVVAEPLR
jgi:hypothetical protein